MSASAVIKNVGIIGGGTMGAGIAQVVASHGFNVTILEVHEDLIITAKESIKKSLARIAAKEFKNDESEGTKFVEGSLNRIQGTTHLTEAFKSSDIVIEAIVENIKFKHEVFAEIDQIAPAHAIFTSTTSSLLIAEIASVTNRKDRFGGLHFFNPAPLMKLLEVVRIKETSDATFNALMDFGGNLRKTCVTCKDTPGFITNRLLIPYIVEAMRMFERGDASIRDIDTALKLGTGHPMGPFALSDYVGLDTMQYIINGFHERYPHNPLFDPSSVLDDKVKQGKYGLKSGEGFFKYQKK